MKILIRIITVIIALLSILICLEVLHSVILLPLSSRTLGSIITIILNSKSILLFSFWIVGLVCFLYLFPKETPKKDFYTFQVYKINSMKMGIIESSYIIYHPEKVFCKDMNELVTQFKELNIKLKRLKGNKNHEIVIEFNQSPFIEGVNNYYTQYTGLTAEEQNEFYRELYKDSF